MFDYNRGYAPDLESSGVMDIFRLPKISYWFFRSQRDANELVAGKPVGPMVFIANYWTANSPLAVRVFSNCEEVALYLNGRLVERRRPDVSRITTNLRHAPFTFKLDRFVPGTLRADGYIAGRKVVAAERCTPGKVAKLQLRFDLSNRPFAASGKDTVFCYVELQDEAGNVVPTTDEPVFFGVASQAQLVGHNPIQSEAGTAAILLESDVAKADCAVYALCLENEDNQVRILSAAGSPDGNTAPRYQITYTTDGTEPAIASPAYSGPISNPAHLRVALSSGGQVVVSAEAGASAPSTSNRTVQVSAAADLKPRMEPSSRSIGSLTQ
jgi:beta-galactosidase